MNPRSHNTQRLLLGFGGLLGLSSALACDPSLAVPDANGIPTAVARVLGEDARSVEIDYEGSPVEVTLDGSKSSDPEGPIKRYRWLSGTLASGGGAAAGSGGGSDMDDGGTAMGGTVERWVPEGEDQNWPEDVVRPKITLPEGRFKFTLWVDDQLDIVSEPSTVEVIVRAPLSPEVMACVETVDESVSPACSACVCAVDEDCRMAAAAELCGPDCWGLVACIAEKCPDYVTTMDASCLLANCADVLSGAAGARMVGRCVVPCAAQCRG